MLFELDKYDRKLHRLPAAAPELPYEPAGDIEKSSLIYWAEHCVECAAPSCYQACDLYEARTDTRCRRFTFGAFKNTRFWSVRGYGVEVAFKKWAKMEAYGNLKLSGPRAVAWSERLAAWAGPGGNILGKVLAWVTKNERWNAATHEGLEALVRRMDRGRSRAILPDAFLLEIYNPTETTIRLQVNFAAVPAAEDGKSGLVQLARSLTRTVDCVKGYSRHEVEFGLLRGIADAEAPFVIRMTPEAESQARLVFLTAEFVKFRARAQAAGGKRVKCVVFDLDNTLWEGVLTEGDEIKVAAGTEQLIRRLDERGILLSIASKNQHDAAWGKLQQLGLSEYFLYPQINWNPKSHSVKTIAEKLNIGIDSLAFVDDNPFELDEVGQSAPEVVCVNANELSSLLSDARFSGSATADARRRRQLYREAEVRESAQESFGPDYLGFLASCEIELEISAYSESEAERVAELVQRTNQLNFSGRKHSRGEMEKMVADEQLEKFVLKCSDRYGSYGTVGFCLVERRAEEVRVVDFMLSCRVQGKLLEKAFFGHLMAAHNAEGAKRLWVNFQATKRNKPAQQVLEAMGFRECAGQADGTANGMVLDLLEALRCEVIWVRCSCAAGETAVGAGSLQFSV